VLIVWETLEVKEDYFMVQNICLMFTAVLSQTLTAVPV